MFAPPVAKAQARTAANPTHGRAPQSWTRETFGRQDHQEAGSGSFTARGAAAGASWNFTEIPVFPADRARRPQARPAPSAPPSRHTLQPKLAVGRVDDPLEHEADHVAEHVMRMPEPEATTSRRAIALTDRVLRRKCDQCEAEEEGQIHRKLAKSSAPGLSVPPMVHDVLRSPGQALDPATRRYMEPRFGWNFSRVRVHADERATQSALAMGARAYTVENHIVFQTNEFDPSRKEGKALLAHELAHVVQQDAAVLRRQPADEPLDAALVREDLLDRIAEDNRKLGEQLDAAQVGIAERDVQVAPFFVREDPEIQRIQRQITSGRTEVPARLARLQRSLTLAAKAALAESDELDDLRAKIAFVGWLNSFTPALLRDTAEYEALLKQQQTGERDYAETVAFFEGVRHQIESTRRLLPERATYLTQRSQFLETQATSAAQKAGVKTDTRASLGQLALLRTIIEASPTLSPYLTAQRAQGAQPTDLRNKRNFTIHGSDDDLQAAARRTGIAAPPPGKKIGGFYDRPTDTIHLPPTAEFSDALHESVHKYSHILLRDRCGTFLNEGVTQYFTDIVLTDQGLEKSTHHTYQQQLACATRFVAMFHRDDVALLYFLGDQGTLHQYLQSGQCFRFCAPEQAARAD
jgi:hypothetical protein